MRVLLVLSLLVCAASAATFFELVVEEWATWKLLHGESRKADIFLRLLCNSLLAAQAN